MASLSSIPLFFGVSEKKRFG